MVQDFMGFLSLPVPAGAVLLSNRRLYTLDPCKALQTWPKASAALGGCPSAGTCSLLGWESRMLQTKWKTSTKLELITASILG